MKVLCVIIVAAMVSCSPSKKDLMETTLIIDGKSFSIDLDKPNDISLAVQNNAGVGAWYIDQPKITHVEVDGYVGKVSLGGSTNFNDVFFNPHSHGTHTECIGHITEEFHSVNDALDKSFFTAQLFSVTPEDRDGDKVITAAMFDDLKDVEVVIIRTLPNTDAKKSRNYSNTNPPYLMEEVMLRFRESGIKHVLIDLPSVDKERDNGALLAHKAFWNFDGEQRMDATITELIYVPSNVVDGNYILDLQVAPIENDAAPSRPILYKVK
ncbi:Kynurenine formamidase [Nonlabens sp. Hel1_33_55]|uniref:cyclase family protein n=1 Tax=Nonlabens sp. Hel1_33_55 TaxID=1336802 RepID=UPI000875AA31|nr:cyclase family protein [Nonlabens sp. Hel1_33_55]SCY40241.1 Kynurenine formamidase [Nonlabens sp. Hel1_33_55]